MSTFVKAERKKAKLRLALVGPSGSGKTMSALKIAQGLGSSIAVLDTEHGSASKYAGDVAEFDTLELSEYHPQKFIDGIKAAAKYDVLIIDSLSHAWVGDGGILAQVDAVAARSRSNNSFSAWRDVTPLHNRLINAILSAPVHVICTMRAKTEYSQEKDDRGRTVIRKVGLAPIQRDGVEYEFDVVGDLNTNHELSITKSRCQPLSGRVIHAPSEALGVELLEWLSSGAPDAALVKARAVCNELLSELMQIDSERDFTDMLTHFQGWEDDIAKARELYKVLQDLQKSLRN